MNQYILIRNDYLMTHFLKSKYLVENYLTEHVSSLIFCHRQHSCHISTHTKLLKPTFISIKTNAYPAYLPGFTAPALYKLISLFEILKVGQTLMNHTVYLDKLTQCYFHRWT